MTQVLIITIILVLGITLKIQHQVIPLKATTIITMKIPMLMIIMHF
jgi:hypothetical protein